MQCRRCALEESIDCVQCTILLSADAASCTTEHISCQPAKAFVKVAPVPCCEQVHVLKTWYGSISMATGSLHAPLSLSADKHPAGRQFRQQLMQQAHWIGCVWHVWPYCIGCVWHVVLLAPACMWCIEFSCCWRQKSFVLAVLRCLLQTHPSALLCMHTHLNGLGWPRF